DQGRRQVIDYYCLGAPFRLRALPRIVDDERVEMRQRREHRLRKALSGQGERLSGQPFECAVLAEVNDRIGAEILGEPRIGGEIAMRRQEGRVVIGRFRVDVVAARRLDEHGDIAGAKAGNCEPAAIKAPRTEEGIAFGSAPLSRYRQLYSQWQR